MKKGDRVKYHNIAGSQRTGIVIQPCRKDGYIGVRFDDKPYLRGMELINPAYLTLVQNKSKGGLVEWL